MHYIAVCANSELR